MADFFTGSYQYDPYTNTYSGDNTGGTVGEGSALELKVPFEISFDDNLEHPEAFTVDGGALITKDFNVGGDINLDGNHNVSGDVITQGNVHSFCSIHYSDKRLKKEIEPLKVSKDLLSGINVYSYKLNRDDSYHYGVIAQEIEKIPELAHIVHNEGEFKSVDYIQLIPVLVNEIKKLKKEVKKIKSCLKT